MRQVKEICLARVHTADEPVVISGDDGSGRTAFLSEIAYLAQNWFNDEVSLIVFHCKRI